VTRTDGTREQWRIVVDPATGTEIDAYPITYCTDCQEEPRCSWSGRCLRVSRGAPAAAGAMGLGRHALGR